MLPQASWRASRRFSVGISSGASTPLPCSPLCIHLRHYNRSSKIWTSQIGRGERDDFVPFKDPGDDPKTTFKSTDRALAVKDNIATSKGFTTCASKILTDHQSPFEASVVERLLKAKAKLLGKTNLDEFGMGSHSVNTPFGAVKNQLPYAGRSAGGSSGGSAMAVASGKARIALGTDTGGSVRLPAAYTGTVGFKPSYGLISRWGVIPYANSLDTVGIIASNTDTVLKAFQIVNSHDSRDPTSLTEKSRMRARNQEFAPEIKSKKGTTVGNQIPKDGQIFSNIKIGVPKEYNIAELDESVRQAWDDALSILQNNGATIVPISLPNTKHALSAYYILAPAEAASNLAKYDGVRYGLRQSGLWDGRGDVLYSETRGSGFGEEVRRRILLGSYTLSSEAMDNYFIKAQRVRRLVQKDFDHVFVVANPLRESDQYDLSDMDESIMLDNKLGPPQVDFIITPTAPTPPPKLESLMNQTPIDSYMNDVFTVPASLAGIPAITIPFPCLRARHQVTPDGGFVGIQIMGQYADDLRLISFAQNFEQITADLTQDIRKEKERIVRYHNVFDPNDLNIHTKEAEAESPEASDVPQLLKDIIRDERQLSPEELQEKLEQSLEESLALWESSREVGRS